MITFRIFLETLEKNIASMDRIFPDIENGKYPNHLPKKPTQSGRTKWEIGSSRIYFLHTSNKMLGPLQGKEEDDRYMLKRKLGLLFKIAWVWNGAKWIIKVIPEFQVPVMKPKNATEFEPHEL